MLVKKITSTINLMEEVKQLENKSGKVEEFEEFNTLLRNNKNRTINEFINVYKVLINYDSQYFELKFPQYIFDIINELLNSINEYKVPNNSKLFSLTEYISELNDELEEKWNKYIDNKTENTINSLENIKSLYDDSTQITNIIQKLKRLKEKWPINNQDLNDLDESIELGRIIINNLDVDEKIQEFLQKINNSNATIEDLDHDILSWLEKNDFKQNLKISFNYVRRQNY